MQWSDVTKPPATKTLRQFAGLCLLLFGAAAIWRWTHGQQDTKAVILAVLGFGVGLAGLVYPPAIRYVFSGWMTVAFPIGWLVSKLVLALLFYGLFTPVSLVFSLTKRDVLHRRRHSRQSYWTRKGGPSNVEEYFRQY